jgi:hypothetical protein
LKEELGKTIKALAKQTEIFEVMETSISTMAQIAKEMMNFN